MRSPLTTTHLITSRTHDNHTSCGAQATHDHPVEFYHVGQVPSSCLGVRRGAERGKTTQDSGRRRQTCEHEGLKQSRKDSSAGELDHHRARYASETDYDYGPQGSSQYFDFGYADKMFREPSKQFAAYREEPPTVICQSDHRRLCCTHAYGIDWANSRWMLCQCLCLVHRSATGPFAGTVLFFLQTVPPAWSPGTVSEASGALFRQRRQLLQTVVLGAPCLPLGRLRAANRYASF